MNKQKKFILLTFLLIFGRFYDVFSTSLYTPNLKQETNIIVSWFGGGWIAALTIQITVTIILIYLLHYYFYKFKSTVPTVKNLSFKQYISFLHFNDTNSFHKLLYKNPVNTSLVIAATGYIASMTLICTSYIVGTSTTLLLISDSYKQYYRHGIPIALYAMAIGLAIYFTLKFYSIEYKKYLTGADLTASK